MHDRFKVIAGVTRITAALRDAAPGGSEGISHPLQWAVRQGGPVPKGFGCVAWPETPAFKPADVGYACPGQPVDRRIRVAEVVAGDAYGEVVPYSRWAPTRHCPFGCQSWWQGTADCADDLETAHDHAVGGAVLGGSCRRARDRVSYAGRESDSLWTCPPKPDMGPDLRGSAHGACLKPWSRPAQPQRAAVHRTGVLALAAWRAESDEAATGVRTWHAEGPDRLGRGLFAGGRGRFRTADICFVRAALYP